MKIYTVVTDVVNDMFSNDAALLIFLSLLYLWVLCRGNFSIKPEDQWSCKRSPEIWNMRPQLTLPLNRSMSSGGHDYKVHSLMLLKKFGVDWPSVSEKKVFEYYDHMHVYSPVAGVENPMRTFFP